MKSMERLIPVVVLALMLCGGCAEPKIQTLSRTCTANDKEIAFEAAVKTLESMQFTIEKADFEQGYISTKPLPAAQFFEFWRKDTVGGYNFAEANLQSISRTAEIFLTTDNSGKNCIECKIMTKRLTMPEREANSSTDMYSLFSKSNKGTQRLTLNKEQRKTTEWIEMGPDEKLQNRILSRIEKNISKMKGK